MELTRKKRIVWGIIMFIGILLIGIVVTGYFLIMGSQPQVKGEIRLYGLKSDVKIIRDSFSVPHIVAANENDLMFAAGYAQAQDRLWQMDFLRRVSEGCLSEVLGSRTLSADKALRTIGFARTAKMITDSLDERTRALLQSYADGVNMFIHSNQDNYPIEFVLLGFSPRDWKIENSVGIARLMAWQLSMGWYVDVTYDKILDSVGFQKTQDILPQFPNDAPVIVKDPPSGILMSTMPKTAAEGRYDMNAFVSNRGHHYSGILDEFVNANLFVKDLIGSTGFTIGSNNWVVSGARSISGKPILANDPHLGHGVPSTWYEMHLKADGWDVTGFALPGSPFVVIGNNRDIAWGVTNVMCDDADFYKEKIKDSLYLIDGKWEKLKWTTEEIAIKDSISVVFSIPFTHRGPIVNGIYDISNDLTDAVSVRWLGHDASGEVTAFWKMNVARDWPEFREASKTYKVPGLNVVYADKDGNIGYQCMSGIPIRRSGNGIAMMDGTTMLNDWNGTVLFEYLPYSFNPDGGYLASANNKISGTWASYFVSNYWEHPSRIKRIDQYLSAKAKFSVEDFQVLQKDHYSFHAKEVVPYILEACKDDSLFMYTGSKDAVNYQYRESYLFLKHWDLKMAHDSRGAAIFNVFFQKLLTHLYKDELGESLFESFIKLSNIPTRVTSQLLINKSSLWWDDVRTKEIENRDEIIRKSLRDAVDLLSERLGREPGGWTWGKLHSLTFEHPLGKQKPLDYLFNVGTYAMGGNTTTVNNTEYHYSDPQFKTLLGASMRRIVSMNDPSHPLTILTLGQSGQPYSDHYYDQTKLWLNGQYKKVTMDIDEIEKTSEVLILKAYQE
ncbi:penicillin acylase family protein [bacterium]|nr:penicillin acylase family protein [bacterium]